MKFMGKYAKLIDNLELVELMKRQSLKNEAGHFDEQY